jgi:hypothetical protein
MTPFVVMLPLSLDCRPTPDDSVALLERSLIPATMLATGREFASIGRGGA